MHLLLLAVVLGPAAMSAGPDGTIRFAPAYPFVIPGTRLLLVQGRMNPDKGFTTQRVEIRYSDADGGIVYTKTAVLRKDGTFAAVVWGLASGRSYNVTAEGLQLGMDMEQILAIGSVVIAR